MARNRPSSIDRLPTEVQSAIAELRRQGRTIDEILDHLNALDVEVSRSALGRHCKSMAEIGASLRRSETMAKFIVEKFGDESDDRVGRANMRILQGALLEILTEDRIGEDGEPVTLSAEEAKSISLSLQRLVTAQRMDAERELKLRELVAKETAAKVGALGKQMGWTAEMAARVRTEIMGVRAPPPQ